jgi:hypothetical protein
MIFQVLVSSGMLAVTALVFPTQAAVALSGELSSRGGSEAAFTWLWIQDTRPPLLLPFSPSDWNRKHYTYV